MSKITSSILIIGNEILSGRTMESNVQFIAKKLSKIGVYLLEVRVVPDKVDMIVSSLNQLRKKYNYVFTTGGIGPTHDDITSESVSKAFKLDYVINKKAYELLKNYYPKGDLNEGRIKMTKMPKGAKLIKNPLTIAPGYYVKNVFVLPGVPKIMQSMLIEVIRKIKPNKPIISLTVNTNLYESIIAKELGKIQKSFKDCEIGSYPHFNIKKRLISVNIVISGIKKPNVFAARKAITSVIKKLGGKAIKV